MDRALSQPAMLAAGESAIGSVLTCPDLNSLFENRQDSMGLERQTIAGLVITGKQICCSHSGTFFFSLWVPEHEQGCVANFRLGSVGNWSLWFHYKLVEVTCPDA